LNDTDIPLTSEVRTAVTFRLYDRKWA